jgi:hypothetical protein
MSNPWDRYQKFLLRDGGAISDHLQTAGETAVRLGENLEAAYYALHHLAANGGRARKQTGSAPAADTFSFI